MFRRNIDERRRKLEREGASLARLLQEKLRAGELTTDQVKLASQLDYKPARQLFPNEELVDWSDWHTRRDFLAQFEKLFLVSLACDYAEHVIHVWGEYDPEDTRPQEAILAARKWVEDPSEEHRLAAALTANRAIRVTSGVTRAVANVAKAAAWAAANAAANSANSANAAANSANSANRAANATTDKEQEYTWQKTHLAKLILELPAMRSNPIRKTPLFKANCPPLCIDSEGELDYEMWEADIDQYYSEIESFEDLVQLNIDFLAGERASPHFIGTINDSNPETVSSLQALIDINMSGLLTKDSQPGTNDKLEKQRAYLAGVCNEELAKFLWVEINKLDGLIAHICPISAWAQDTYMANKIVSHFDEFEYLDDIPFFNDKNYCGAIPVTYEESQAVTFMPAVLDDFGQYKEHINGSLFYELEARLFQINIIDTKFGRHAMSNNGLLVRLLKILKKFKGDPFEI